MEPFTVGRVTRVIITLVVMGVSDTQEDTCSSNGNEYLKMCSDRAYRGTDLYLDTELFLDTGDHFCYCEINTTYTLTLNPSNTDNSSCGPLLSVKMSAETTLRQFTCKLSYPLNVTVTNKTTVYMELKGLGTLHTCIRITSDDEFNVTCYTVGVFPPSLNIILSTSIPSADTSSVPSTPLPQTSASASSSSTLTPSTLNSTSTGSITTLSYNFPGLQTTPSLPLTAGDDQGSFVLILTACVLGFLTLVAVLMLIICKYVRHVRRTREREDNSYDITMRPTVQKISARMLSDSDSVTVDNCLYETSRNSTVPSNVARNHSKICATSRATRAENNLDGLIYADLDHSDAKPADKPASSSEVEYSVVLRKV